jgi:CRISPR-associated RAMP protein (TIGR02581 family)
MLKRLRSECEIQLEIATDGPLLIKSGQTFATGADMTAVRTMRNGRWEIYIPGSSLKGALRAHAERISRTLAPNGHGCCDPFKEAENAQQTIPHSCSSRLLEWRKDKKIDALDPQEIYRESCPICKLFGSLAMAARLAFNDAHEIGTDVDSFTSNLVGKIGKAPKDKLAQDVKSWLSTSKSPAARAVVERTNVGIDRRTGGASSGSLFEMEVVTAARFVTSLYLRNFELWQLGLLAFVLRDFEDGVIKLGMGKSRGLGRLKATVTNLEIRYLGLTPAPSDGALCELRGMSMLESAPYGFSGAEASVVPLYPDAKGKTPPDTVQAASDGYGLRTIYHFSKEQCEHLWRKVAPMWVTYAKTHPHAMAAVTGDGQ